MPVPMSGEPVRISYLNGNGSSASTSTSSLGLYSPGTSTTRALGAAEQLVLCSLVMATASGFGGTMYITTLPGGTLSTSMTQANILLAVQFVGDDSHEWLDDGTGAMTGLPGVVPSVVVGIANGSQSTFVTGTGLIVNTAPVPGRNPQFANLTQNPNGNF